jgi:hypothetical protein
MAVLSGFGSICAGWDTYLSPNRLVTEADVMRAKMSVQMTQDLIADKQRKIEHIEGRIHEKVILCENLLIIESGAIFLYESGGQHCPWK